MSVPYEAAITTIHGMFNGTVDRDVVCTILEANNGHMEKTVECLLTMSGEIPVDETATTTETPEKANQIREDEQFARMFQDQLFMQQLEMHPEFSSVFGSNTRTNNDTDFDITEKLKQLGDVAKLKFKELALKFRNRSPNEKPDVKYTTIEEEEDTEVIAFDSSLAKRTATNFEEESVEEVPLEMPKKQPKSVLLESKPSKKDN